jgi:hypothetical protein
MSTPIERRRVMTVNVSRPSPNQFSDDSTFRPSSPHEIEIPSERDLAFDDP